MLTLRRLFRLTRLDREDGQVIPMMAIFLFVLLLMTAVVVDGGNLFQNRQSLQNAADASAIAAALEVAKGNCTPTVTGPCATYAGKYAGLNGAGDGSALGPCPPPPTVNETKPPPDTPGCYLYPYVDSSGATHNDEVEVWLTRTTTNFFGGLQNIPGSSTQSARAVAGLTAGPPPDIAFLALNNASGCGANHSLFINNSGVLTVNNNLYVNSCNDDDAFDVNGAGGTITATDIFVHGGWENRTGTHVIIPVNGTTCPLPSGHHGVATPYQAGCPHTNQAIQPDPFAFAPTPALGSGNLGTPISITKASRGSNSDGINVARVVTASPHGLAIGNTVTISGVGTYGGGTFDGTYTVASVPNPTTFTYADPGSNVPVILQKQMSGGVATITATAPTTLSPSGPDTTMTVVLDNAFNVVNAAVTAAASGMFSYNVPAAQRTFSVTKKGLQQGTATLTLTSPAGFAPTSNGATVINVGALFNGSFPNVSFAGGNITYSDPATSSVTVAKKAIATVGGNLVATLTTTTNHVFPGDSITVNLSPADSRFDGTPSGGATAGGQGGAGGTTLSYQIPPVTATVSSTAASGGNVTLTTATVPFETTDTVSVDSPLAYAIAPLVLTAGTNFNAATKTFTYTSKTFKNAVVGGTSWTKSGNFITVSTASAHRLHSGDTIKVTTAPGPAACSNAGATTFPVTATPTNTTFTYQVPVGCTPGGSGNQTYNFQIWNANSASASGTVTLTTMPATNTGGSVTVPGFIAANTAATGTALLTDVPTTTVGGTFTPAWIPTSGLFAQDFPGSPALPAQYHPANGSTLTPGTYYGGLCIGLPSGTACNDANCAAALTTQTYPGTAPVLSADITNTKTTFDVTQQKIAAGDVINIGTEDMLVSAVTPIGATGQTLTVTRGYLAATSAASAAAAHKSGATIKKVVSSQPATSVTLADGVYVMAGGGFYVCGSANLNAPHVMIFNTDDMVGGTELAAIGQVEFFTLGTVSLHPQTTGQYAGLTIFQDHNNVVNSGKCDNKKDGPSSLWDIALVAMWNPTGGDSLGAISGTIYADNSSSNSAGFDPGTDEFGDAVSGTATLAVITDCILIDGATSTFNFDPNGGQLFGAATATLSG